MFQVRDVICRPSITNTHRALFLLNVKSVAITEPAAAFSLPGDKVLKDLIG